MPPTKRDLLLAVLRACYEAAPNPLYPTPFAEAQRLDRTLLDRVLDELRLNGLIRLTEWVAGMGQGYTLTQAGLELLEHPNRLHPGAPLPRARPEPDPHAEPDGPRSPAPLIQPGRPTATLTLIALNVGYFFFGIYLLQHGGMSLSEATNLYLNGAQQNPRVHHVLREQGSLRAEDVRQNGQWWRILASAFIHLGIFHIGMNMYALYVLGQLLEAMWGSFRMVVVYFISAITGGCIVVWTGSSAVGASGAICGLLGSLGIWVLLNREHLPPAMASGLTRMVLINLVLLFVISVAIPGVSWQGHLGGAVGGALASFPMQLSRHGHGPVQRTLGLLASLLVPLVFLALTAIEFK